MTTMKYQKNTSNASNGQILHWRPQEDPSRAPPLRLCSRKELLANAVPILRIYTKMRKISGETTSAYATQTYRPDISVGVIKGVW